MSTEINLKTDRDFELWFKHLQTKYGEDFEILNGFHDSQLNFSDFIDGFIDKNIADATIDSNANAHNKDICSLLSERCKSEDKLFAFNKIFYEIKKKYGLEIAREWLESEWNGSFYLHNAHTSSYQPYCNAYSLDRLATEGLFFLDDYNYQPPKHLTTFLDDVVEFISFFSNRTSGAVGIPNILIWSWYFWKKDIETGHYIKDPDYYMRQCFQKLIYRLNQPWLRRDQSSFTNVSIYDRHYLEGVFGGMEYPDGTFVIDHIEDLIEHQKVFMDVVAQIRRENMFTFPVISTMLFYKNGKFQDEEFAKWSCKRNLEWNDSNFFISDNIGILSNCCRLLSDTTKLSSFINSIGGTAISIGSVQVNTINLMRIAYECNKDKNKYLEILKDRTLLCIQVLDIIRHIIQRNIEKGLLPNYCDGGININNQYNTIG